MCDQGKLLNGGSFRKLNNETMEHRRCYRENFISPPTSNEGYVYRLYHIQSTEKTDFTVNQNPYDMIRTNQKSRVHANTCHYMVENIPKRRDRKQADVEIIQSMDGKCKNHVEKTTAFSSYPQCSNNTYDHFTDPVMASLSHPCTEPSGSTDAWPVETITVSDDEEMEYTYMFDPFPLDNTEETINNTNKNDLCSVSNHEHLSAAHVSDLSSESQFTSLQNHTDCDANKTQDCWINLNGVAYNQSPAQLIYYDDGTGQTGYHQLCLTTSSQAGLCEQQVEETRSTRKASLPCYSCAVGEKNMCGCVPSIQSNVRTEPYTEHCVPVQSARKNISKGRLDASNDDLKRSQIHLSNGLNHNQLLQAIPNQQLGVNMTEVEYDYTKHSHNSSNNQKTKLAEQKQNYLVQERQQLEPNQLLVVQNEKKQSTNETSNKMSPPKATNISESNNRPTAKYAHKDKRLHTLLADLHSNCDKCKGCKRLNLKLKAAVM